MYFFKKREQQLYWNKHGGSVTERQGRVSTFSPADRTGKSWVCLSRAGLVSVMRSLSFELTERAIQLLLGCQHDAESFLSAEHSLVGEIQDVLAQAYAALGTACVSILCSREHVGLVRLAVTLEPHPVCYLLVFQLRLLSLPVNFPDPKNVRPRLIVVLFWIQICISLQRTGRSPPPTFRGASEWLRLATGHPVSKWAMSSSNWPRSFSMGKSFSHFPALGRPSYCSSSHWALPGTTCFLWCFSACCNFFISPLGEILSFCFAD